MFEEFEQYLQKSEQELDIADYVENIEPKLVVDFSGLSPFLFSDRSQKEIGDFVLSANKTIVYLDKNRIHDKEDKLNPYDIYKQFSKPEFLLNKGDFNTYFKYIKDIYLDSKELTCNNKLVNAISALKNEGVSNDIIGNYYTKLCNLQNGTIKDIWANIDELDSDISSKYSNAYNNFLKSLGTDIYTILDFFSYLYLNEESNDVPLEIRAILPKVIHKANSINDNGPIYLIHPSIHLIKKLFSIRYPFKNKKVYIFLNDETLASILASKIQIVSNFRFYHISRLSELVNNSDTSPSLSVILANNISNISFVVNSLDSLFNFANRKHSYMLFIGDSTLRSKDQIILNCLLKTNIFQLDLFPFGIYNSTTPKMKTLLYGEYGYIDQSSNILVNQYSLPRNKNDVLNGKTLNIQIERDQFFDTEFSIRKKFFDEYRDENTKTNEQRKQATIYKYSNEISIEYTKSGEGTKEKPYRIEAFVINPFGKRIENVSGSTKLLKDDSIENWLENEYLFSTIKRKNGPISIRKEISSVYIPYYLNKQITIKTLYYIHLELEDDLPSYTHNLIQEISNTYLSDIPINQISKDSLESFMELSTITNNYTYLQVLVVLSKLFNTGIEYGNCRRNPAQSLIKNRKEDNWGLKSIRSALTQKFFYSKQINQIIDYASNLIKAKKDIGLGITILLRLYLGLETNFTSALLWKDLHLGDTPYLEINRQCKDRNLAFVNLDNPNQHIRTPLIKKILDILLKEKERQLKELANGDEKYLENCTIVYGTDIVIEDTMCVYSPYELNKKIRKLIIKVGMDEDIIVVPDTKNGTVETNLAYYPDDIFKFNYRHYILKLHPEIEAGQLFYLLGQKIPEDTLSNHYIGYGDEITINKLLQFQPDYEEVKK